MRNHRKRPSKEVFIELYNKHTTEEVAAMFDTTFQVVHKWRLMYGVKSKRDEKTEAVNRLTLTDWQQSIIIGSLLGDGCITKTVKSTHNSYFTENHSIKQAEYLNYKAEQLGDFTSSIRDIVKSPSKIRGREVKGGIFRLLRTISHPVFTSLERKWYKRNDSDNHVLRSNGQRIKIVPQDLNLSPETVAFWYMDDGWHAPENRHAELCTNGFLPDEVKILATKLSCLGISSYCKTNSCGEPVIYVQSKSYLNFIEMVKPFVVCDCMKYKIDLTNYQSPKTIFIPPETVDRICNLWDECDTYGEIADQIGVKRNVVGAILRRNGKISGCRVNNTSGIEGVSVESNGRWSAQIKINGQPISLGLWDTKEEAVTARQEAEKLRDDGVFEPRFYSQIRKQSLYAHRGCFFDTRRNRWVAYINYNRMTFYFGPFLTEEQAKKTRAEAELLGGQKELLFCKNKQKNKYLRKNNKTGTEGVHWDDKEQAYVVTIALGRKRVRLGGFTNLEEAKSVRFEADKLKSNGVIDKETYLQLKPRRKNNSTGITGVSQKHGKWVAQIQINKKKKHLGIFTTKEEAIAARRKAEEEIQCQTSLKNN
jgi:hypothetical protein